MPNQTETAHADANISHPEPVPNDLSKEHLARIAQDLFENGKTIAEIKGITRDDLDALYHVAYQTYASGDYQRASSIFRVLCFLDHLQFKHWLGLGSCKQMLGQYADAIEAYQLAMLLHGNDPRPHFHTAECHLALNHREAAISNLSAARELAGDRLEYAELCQRANNLMAVLNTTAG